MVACSTVDHFKPVSGLLRNEGTLHRQERRVSKTEYLPAMSASKYVPEFKALKERIKDRTKIPMKAQVAIQRKLLILMYTLGKSDSEYEKDHHQQRIARTEAQATQDSALEQLPLEV